VAEKIFIAILGLGFGIALGVRLIEAFGLLSAMASSVIPH
jgi:hypothetical protein